MVVEEGMVVLVVRPETTATGHVRTEGARSNRGAAALRKGEVQKGEMVGRGVVKWKRWHVRTEGARSNRRAAALRKR